ncbi:hypothetical protein J5226_02030 [Lysobacter sp. K5869]|uniref:hypothetical protein n=1 Tax=Lysobacter sp. K5869 TaxID=2820808 RepID=UPI001C05F371|nr:hypothetical protein [Lysobacter sp. K5869]QWP77207.1 hypothetical protein J5226_02030 [Lysobacter sp. K5869]
MANAAVDNDIILKGVSYGFLNELLASIPNAPHQCGILGSAKYVLRKALQKRPPSRFSAAKEELEAALALLEILEPTEQEAALAAQLEFQAQQLAIPMHVGECQLVSMLVTRDLHHVLTGDRKAIMALASIVSPAGISAQNLSARFICFEQAVRHLVNSQGAVEVRAAICAEREVDLAMRICFSCASPEVGEASWLAGLDSHIEELRAASGDLLAA